MNIEELPIEIKNDIEDQSLTLLSKIKEFVLVIGGWAVRAHLGDVHHRFTLDVDGVASGESTELIARKLIKYGFNYDKPEWGIQFNKKYDPTVKVPESIKDEVNDVKIRIEISSPRIFEASTPHYFDFNLDEYIIKEIPYHNNIEGVEVKVPPIEHMTAVKLGLPVDYKNNHDAAMLLQRSDIQKVIDAIKQNDHWSEIVLRRLPKSRGRITQKGRLENTLAIAAGLNLKDHVRRLDIIEEALKRDKDPL